MMLLLIYIYIYGFSLELGLGLIVRDNGVEREGVTNVTCPVVTNSYGALKKCSTQGGPDEAWIPCDRPIPFGGRIFLECPRFYERTRGSAKIVCLRNGTWNDEPLNCKPICGKRDSPAAVPMIVRGQRVKPEASLPWHATLFSRENEEWRFFCGGTLIAERLVLTAAHCVWQSLAHTIRVGFAIFSRDLAIERSSAISQLIGVEAIKVQDSYQDYEGNYGSDIALLILEKPVIINNFVSPACVDLDGTSTGLAAAKGLANTGLVAGFGITENNTYSEKLMITSLRIVSDRVCRENQSPDFRKYIAYTSFCAGWVNGTGVCNGDSGGGLALTRRNSSIWEVHGVVSLSPRKPGSSLCDPMRYTVFTRVPVYARWIRDIVNSIPIVGPPDASLHPNRDHVILP